ncbi:uncharacterized protein [Spinacia oleracea]|uniref:Retrotransposon gag domain-containing protein n=1 Tax=Spinacia oleracea TaxID=3562 RepID=A0A9R0JEF4_SPIOL|nr:uncharacterized protein LOC110805237 [Spinacia oleracea]
MPLIKVPTIEPFDGTSDPEEHMAAYAAQMDVQTGCGATWCRYFPTTLKGLALICFNKHVPKGSIKSYSKLEKVFISPFGAGRRHQKTSVNLMAVRQGETETIRNYIKRFNEEVLKIHNLKDETKFAALLTGLQPDDFKFELIKSGVSNLEEAMEKAQRNIQATDICEINWGGESGTRQKQKPNWGETPKSDKKKKNSSHDQTQPSLKKSVMVDDHGEDPRYNCNRREIYLDLKGKDILPKPPAIICRELKKALDHLADKGKLNNYLRKNPPPKAKSKEKESPSDDTRDYIGVIAGGLATGGSVSKAKDSLWALKHQVLKVASASQTAPVMTFGGNTSHPIQESHDDPLVIEMRVANSMVGRVLVDSGSSADIITLKCLEGLKYSKDDLKTISQPLIVFGGQAVHPQGTIKLPVMLGPKNKGRRLLVQFLVVDISLPYNVILGRSLLNKIKAAISVYQLLMQFELEDATAGKIFGDQQVGRRCYVNSLKRGTSTPQPLAKKAKPEETRKS